LLYIKTKGFYEVPYTSQAYYASLSADQQRAMFTSHTSIGYHPETYDELLIPDIDRYSGTYISGMPGSGKSALLENLIVHDASMDKAVIVIDPHLDLVTRCIGSIPAHRLGNTYLLDMEDESHPFRVNIFATGELKTSIDHTQAVDRILHIFEVLWPDVLSQQHLPRYLRMATIVFLANPGKTLVDMYDFLLDDSVRRTMLQRVADPTVKQFWKLQYDDLPPATRLSRVQPLLGRLEQLFAGRTLVRNIVGQQQNSIDFRKSIENKELIFIKLPLKIVPEDAKLIGTILVAQIHAALFSFVDIPEDRRPGVSLFIDEFQNFVSPDIAELFTEGRKFGMRITVAHQFRGQLPVYLREATMTARTKVTFQSTPEDGRELAHLYPAQSEGVRPENVDAHPTETLISHSHLHPPVVQEFIEYYLRPIRLEQVGSHGNKVRIRNTGFNMLDGVSTAINGGRGKDPEVNDPTVYLDYVLQQVMITGDYLLPILPDAVIGFSNCGHSFFQKVRSIRDNDRRLLADIPAFNLPRYLLVPTAEGSWRWNRNPEGGAEQLFHFLFHLRMTMRYLAEHPLGKQSTASTADVGKMLNQLPRRSAFVRSGDTIGVIYTHDTPKPPTQLQLFSRIKDILEHTRVVYCHPRTEIEQRFTAPQSAGSGVIGQPLHQPDTSVAPVQPDKQVLPPPQPPLSGWEEA
jgi:hypothetical protein